MRTGEKTPVSFAGVPVQVVTGPVAVSRGGMRQYKVTVSVEGLRSALPADAPAAVLRRGTISVTVADKPDLEVRPGAWVEFADSQAMQFCVTTHGCKFYGLSLTATSIEVQSVSAKPVTHSEERKVA